MQQSDQYKVFEQARKRIKQKKRLYFHFVLFLVGSTFFIILNKIIKFHEELDWYVWAIFVWLFLLIIHFVNVFVMNKFFGKNWVQVQTEKLVEKHFKKIEKLEKKLEKQGAFVQPQTDSQEETIS